MDKNVSENEMDGFQYIEEKKFSKAIDEVEDKYHRIQEIKRLLSFMLWRKPHDCGFQVPTQEGYYILRTDESMFNTFPQLDVLYEIDEDKKEVKVHTFKIVLKAEEE